MATQIQQMVTNREVAGIGVIGVMKNGDVFFHSHLCEAEYTGDLFLGCELLKTDILGTLELSAENPARPTVVRGKNNDEDDKA